MTIVLPDNPVAGYAIQNVNLVGVGVADSENPQGVFNFRGIASTNASLIVTYDADKHTIFLTLDVDSIIDDLPDASTTQRGVLETATDAEAIAKTLTNKIIVPSNLAALGASQTFAGFVELATNAETQAGLSTTLAVTPAGLASLTATQKFTTTFSDAVARAAAVPAFKGQFGSQLDTTTAFMANGTVAGNWIGLLTLGSASNELPAATAVNTATFAITLSGGGAFVLDQCPLTVNGGLTASIIDGGTIRFGNANPTVFDWGAGVDLRIANTQVPANSVLTTTGLGVPTSALKSAFISTFNVQTGWAVTNPSVSRTLDVAAATLEDVRAVLGTLINDLKAVLLPAT